MNGKMLCRSALFLLVAILSTTPVTADTIEVTVCTFDSSDSSELNGSTVEVREGTNPISSGQTDSTGCITLQVEVASSSSIEDELPGLGSLRLGVPFPNPSAAKITVPFSNDTPQPLRVGVFDILGREVGAAAFGVAGAGNYAITIDTRSLSRGIYFYKVAGRDETAGGQFVKVGEGGSTGAVTIGLREAPAVSASKRVAAALNVTIARLGYQGVEEVRETDDGGTLDFFLTKEALISDFDYSASSLQVTFTNQSTGADTFDWDFGDGTTSSEENPTHLYSTEGDYDVSLVASMDGAVDSTSKTVSVSASSGDNEMIPLDRTDLYTAGDNYYGEAYAWPDDPSPDPTGSVIVGTGYSNASQHFNTFGSQYQSLINPEFVNCGVGSNAIENWIGQNATQLFTDCVAEVEAAGFTADDVAVTLNLIANQLSYPPFPEPGSGVDSLEVQVQRLGALLEQYFPNAINTYTTGEPAHWVAESKCPRICEPVRYETGFGVNRALDHMNPDKHIHGAYLWSALDIANDSGELWVIEDFIDPQPDNTANQHPSDQGREKASRIWHQWLSDNYPSWYLD